MEIDWNNPFMYNPALQAFMWGMAITHILLTAQRKEV